jgi:2-(1,2-epoxy-1,2-dihydrophenyl)acetyl-CoA isomerase
MTYETIRFQFEAGIFRITFNRPDRLNSLSAAMQNEILQALDVVETGSPRVLLITGVGRAFCAGQDLSERNVEAGPLDLGQGPETFYNPFTRRIAALPCPVVCAVNGTAAGAGVNLAIACDIVVAKRSARFVQAFSSIGLVPDAGGTWHLPRIIGQARALGYTLLGETLSADEARELGLIWRVCDEDSFDQEVEEIVAKLGMAPTFGLASAKRAIRSAAMATLDDALDRERDMQRVCGQTHDYKEGVKAFKAKRLPRFLGQ